MSVLHQHRSNASATVDDRRGAPRATKRPLRRVRRAKRLAHRLRGCDSPVARASVERAVLRRALVIKGGERACSVAEFLAGGDDALDEPLHDGEDGGVVEALDLVRLKREGAAHASKRALDGFAEFEFLAHLDVVVVEEVDVDVDVGGGDGPREAADDLVEGREGGDARAEIPAVQEEFGDLPGPIALLLGLGAERGGGGREGGSRGVRGGVHRRERGNRRRGNRRDRGGRHRARSSDEDPGGHPRPRERGADECGRNSDDENRGSEPSPRTRTTPRRIIRRGPRALRCLAAQSPARDARVSVHSRPFPPTDRLPPLLSCCNARRPSPRGSSPRV